MSAYDRCPICKDDFRFCPHTVTGVETYLQKRDTDKATRKQVVKILKEFNLIPPNAK